LVTIVSRILVLVIAVLISFSARSADLGVQTDIIMGKIIALMKAEKYADAIPYFVQLEGSGVTLPESFYYYQIQALYKTRDVEQTLKKTDAYFARFRRAGKYYGNVVEISSEFGLIADRENARKAGELRKAEEVAQARLKLERDRLAQLEREKRWVETSSNTVRDSVTGIEWTKPNSAGEMTWQAAIDHCNAKGGEWHLPKAAELAILYDLSLEQRCGGQICHIASTFGVKKSLAWTSEAGRDAEDGSPLAGTFNFRSGQAAILFGPESILPTFCARL
jgi:hypothetical protein